MEILMDEDRCYTNLKYAVVLRALKDYVKLKPESRYHKSAEEFLFSDRLLTFTDLDANTLLNRYRALNL